jgi:hypothetical protein
VPETAIDQMGKKLFLIKTSLPRVKSPLAQRIRPILPVVHYLVEESRLINRRGTAMGMNTGENLLKNKDS